MNSRRRLIALVILALVIPAGGRIPAPSGSYTEKGNLVEKVRKLAAGQFKQGSNRYRIPTPEEQEAWSRIVGSIARNRIREASRTLADQGFPYRLVRFREESDGRDFILLEEEEPRIYGWGLFVFAVKPSGPLLIEVPHPVSDSGTEIQGIRAFLDTDARAFILSGVHRRSNVRESPCTQATENSRYAESDPAHNVNTIFHAAHKAIVDARPDTVAIQLHGMQEREVCPNVYISTGTASITENAARFLHCLKEMGVEASIYDGTVSCPLIASTNVQGRYSNGTKTPCTEYAKDSPEPGRFIHVEQEPSIRSNGESQQRIIEALKCAFPLKNR
jgi:hypothetical protein